MYAYVHVYVYVYVYVCICVYVYVYMYMYMYICMYMYMYMYVYIYAYITYLSTCVCLYLYPYLYYSTSTYVMPLEGAMACWGAPNPGPRAASATAARRFDLADGSRPRGSHISIMQPYLGGCQHYGPFLGVHIQRRYRSKLWSLFGSPYSKEI